MKKIILFFLVIAIVIACSSGDKENTDRAWDVTVKGKVGFPVPGGSIILKKMQEDGRGDTVSIKLNSDSYSFEKKMHLTEPGYYQINFYDKQFIKFILGRSDLDISVDGNNAQGFQEVKGSADQELITKVQDIINTTQHSLNASFVRVQLEWAVEHKDQPKVKQLQEEYMNIINTGNDSVAAILRREPASLGLIELLRNNILDKDRYRDVYESTAEKVQKEWPNSSLSKDFVAFVKEQY